MPGVCNAVIEKAVPALVVVAAAAVGESGYDDAEVNAGGGAVEGVVGARAGAGAGQAVEARCGTSRHG